MPRVDRVRMLMVARMGTYVVRCDVTERAHAAVTDTNSAMHSLRPATLLIVAAPWHRG